MNFLDVLPIDPAERARWIREIKPVVIDTIDTIRDTINATKDAVADSVAQTANGHCDRRSRWVFLSGTSLQETFAGRQFVPIIIP